MIAFVRHLVFHDFWLKLFSLVLAVLIWCVVYFASQKGNTADGPLSLTAKERTFFHIPVMVMFSAEEVRSSKIAPNQVDVTLLGDGKFLQTIQSKDIRVMVDLNGIEAAHLLKRVEVDPPPGITRFRVTPQEVDVVITPKS